jgi:hypothetical protein
MITIKGTILSAGEGVQGLRIMAYEEVQIGMPQPPKPCKLSYPSASLVGEAMTDASGAYQIQFVPREPSPLDCAFMAHVRVRVFDGMTLVWASPKKTVAETVFFDFVILPETPPSVGEEEATIQGRLTFCGRPAEGLRVVAYEVVRIGMPFPPKPCQISQPSPRNLGAVTLANDGRFTIAFTPRSPSPLDCFFESHVRIDAFDAVTRLWQSAKLPVTPLIEVDEELLPVCTPGSSVIHVVDGAGNRVPGAEVFVNGSDRGRTDVQGRLVVHDLSVGDKLAARLRILENETSRDGHAVDSDRNWNYRVYVTSVALTHDRNGDNVRLRLFEVSDPSAIQELRVSRHNTLVGLNIRASVEWNATASQLGYYHNRFLEMSELLFNATDGQFLIERLSIADAREYWGSADYRIYASVTQASTARLDGLFGSSGRIRMNPYDSFYPGTLLHELGHYAFGPRDEYKDGGNWDPANGPVRCTLASSSTDTPFADGAEKDSCVMRGARFASRKKFCSQHPENPHVDGTAQGALSCWDEIFARFSDIRWRLKSPTTRQAIVGRLPDSGVPLPIGTTAPASADPIGSFIPVREWKPRWHIRNTGGTGNECAGLIARTELASVPVNGVRITLRDQHGRRLDQGTTRDRTFPDGISTADGELTIRGARVGDRLFARKKLGFGQLIGKADVAVCDTGPVIIELKQFGFSYLLSTEPLPGGELVLAAKAVEPVNAAPPTIFVRRNDDDDPHRVPLRPSGTDGDLTGVLSLFDEDQEIEVHVTLFDPGGEPFEFQTTIVLRDVPREQDLHVFSADGQIEVIIPPGVVSTPARFFIEEVFAKPFPPLNGEDLVLVGPYNLRTTGGIRGAGIVHFNIADGAMVGRQSKTFWNSLEVLRYDEATGNWQAIAAKVSTEPAVVTSRLDRSGVYALIQRGRAR